MQRSVCLVFSRPESVSLPIAQRTERLACRALGVGECPMCGGRSVEERRFSPASTPQQIGGL
jgi:hypothetical protein